MRFIKPRKKTVIQAWMDDNGKQVDKNSLLRREITKYQDIIAGYEAQVEFLRTECTIRENMIAAANMRHDKLTANRDYWHAEYAKLEEKYETLFQEMKRGQI